MSSWTLFISFEPCGGAGSVRFQSGKPLSSISRSSGVMQLQFFVWGTSPCAFNGASSVFRFEAKINFSFTKKLSYLQHGDTFYVMQCIITSNTSTIHETLASSMLSMAELAYWWCTNVPEICASLFTYPQLRVVVVFFKLRCPRSLSARV